jgi:O-acetyl-ADP-ribose deacetylase (regulator of RNase III)
VIHEVQGDILLTTAQAIAHGVSPNDHFDAGLALALREMWPSMAKDFRHYTHGAHPKPGELWTYHTPDGRTIFNLLTQEGDHHSGSSGRASSPNVNHALKRLRHELNKGEIRSVALPRLATGAGGLEWSDVRPLIEKHLGDLPIPVYLYVTYHTNEAGKELAGAA